MTGNSYSVGAAILAIGVAGSVPLQAMGQPGISSPATPSSDEGRLWYGVVSSGPNPSSPIIQIGPFKDRTACEAALSAADKRNVIEFGICVADRS